ncbi:MAG: hypothetical protein OYH76_24595 [Defluviicoccus sp.]|nr:hypothetical protein [Defluviicoccus sp.]MDE0279088.1 hypothetical protein [Defluviicoccus sp.]
MTRVFLASAAITAPAGIVGLIAEGAGLADAWAVATGIVALFAWIAFERFSRR